MVCRFFYNELTPCPDQFGFRRLRDRESALSAFTDFVFSSFNDRSQTIALSLDLTAAFDSVRHDVLFQRLLDAKIPDYLLSCVNHFLSYRSSSILLDGASFKYRPLLGSPRVPL